MSVMDHSKKEELKALLSIDLSCWGRMRAVSLILNTVVPTLSDYSKGLDMALPVMPTLGSCKQDDQEFDLIFSYIGQHGL